MASSRAARVCARNALKIFNFKPSENSVKCESRLIQVLKGSTSSSGSLSPLSISSKSRRVFLAVNKRFNCDKSIVESITRSSTPISNVLASGNTSLLITLCSALDELSTEGDEDSTNRKKRIYLAGRLNDDP
ncbi:uncharacterized protein LOC124452893 [Xenia sp. Carnegie-2017]|uniref:uncharacterized protein LOC124452893 n=1 Tax=Xenia sp. Carnegie-2017 TaxID=2897299 RepID=UPI001F037D0D|nr:uncharacterized protein LOC124452893 [Xenia sp. Carnegie-2017]